MDEAENSFPHVGLMESVFSLCPHLREQLKDGRTAGAGSRDFKARRLSAHSVPLLRGGCNGSQRGGNFHYHSRCSGNHPRSASATSPLARRNRACAHAHTYTHAPGVPYARTSRTYIYTHTIFYIHIHQTHTHTPTHTPGVPYSKTPLTHIQTLI